LSFLNDSNMPHPRAARVGHHLAREQLHALAGQLVRDADLAAGQDDADAELLLVLLQLLPHRRGAADDAEDALLKVVPRLLGVEEMLLVLEQRRGRLRRRVPGRAGADALEQVAREVPHPRLELLARL